jgi:hypothetical protein
MAALHIATTRGYRRKDKAINQSTDSYEVNALDVLLFTVANTLRIEG